MVTPEILKQLKKAQKAEITEHFIYSKLSRSVPQKENQQVLQHIAEDELKHYGFWKKYTKQDVRPNMFLVWWYFLLSKLFGLTFGIKLRERGEKLAQENYALLVKEIPEMKKVLQDEYLHERKLIGMLQEEKLKYVGSIVLGMNDALVELTGALAGLTLALNNGHIVAVTGLITGIAASLSMAASEFQSRRADNPLAKDSFKASIYTGITYLITVILLILPYLLLSNILVALVCTLVIAVLIITAFTFYTSVAQDLKFGKRFLEMATISLGVAAVTFGIGYLVKMFWNLPV
ncbi:MAG: VIT1/CCC1 transporter family protein [Candidatus Woesearchaeota archaeon]